MPVNPGDTDMPYLVYDGLDQPRSLRRAYLRKVIRAVLERKYKDLCPPEYVQAVVRSVRDDPVQIRPPRYIKTAGTAHEIGPVVRADLITLVVNDRHTIHHVHDRGYVEAPVRISRILRELGKTSLFEIVKPEEYPLTWIKAVHDADFVEYLRRMCLRVPEGESVYPYVFPIRNSTRPPKEMPVRAGYYCIDTFTPLNRNAYLAAKRAADCTLTAAKRVLEGSRLAYALVRPPGHHAERRVFGGFCYFNNNAVAANFLSAHSKVAILDLDYHHGNGQQNIFYERSDVLTVSIHGHPSFAYPYFSGFSEEVGKGPGKGFNLNIPLPEEVDGPRYRRALERAFKAIRRFSPSFLIVALGLDTARDDPTGTWNLTAKDFEQNGFFVGSLRLPTLVVQEGGYRTRTLGVNARNFFKGLSAGARKT
jgi:acetoin utilization deacetylase AcuC-like enzyme